MSKLLVYTDGASRGNPGDAGIGVVVTDEDGAILREISEPIGRQTNNVAEYSALIAGLRAAAELGATEVEVCTDSELVARQIAGTYLVKSPSIRPLYNEVVSLLRRFRSYKVSHVYREFNRRADQLACAAATGQHTCPSASQLASEDWTMAIADARQREPRRQKMLDKAVRVLQDMGAREVYMFRSVASGNNSRTSHIDLAVRGLGSDTIQQAVSELLRYTGMSVNAVDLDDYDALIGYLLMRGLLNRLA